MYTLKRKNLILSVSPAELKKLVQQANMDDALANMPKFDIPDWMNETMWLEWIDHYIEVTQGKIPTRSQKKGWIRKLEGFRPKHIDYMKYSIERQYRSIFEPKEYKPTTNQTQDKARAYDNAQRDKAESLQDTHSQEENTRRNMLIKQATNLAGKLRT